MADDKFGQIKNLLSSSDSDKIHQGLVMIHSAMNQTNR